MRSTTRLLFAAGLTLFCGCNKSDAPDCIQSAGDSGIEWRTMPNYESIEIRDNIQLILIDSQEEKIKVEGPTNLLPEIKTELSNGVLRITNDNTCNFMRSYKHVYTVTLYGQNFRSIRNQGTGDISSGNTLSTGYVFIENRRTVGTINLKVSLDSLRIINTAGYSDMYIDGEADVFYLFHQGLGLFDASNLDCRAVFANNNSINDVHLTFRDYLYAAINDNGNIYYQGPSTSIDADHFGSGSLIAE